MRFKIIKMGINGEGIAYKNGRPVFIEGALLEEEVEAKIYDEYKTYAKAKLIRVLEPSKERIDPPCPYFEKCGACSLMHLNYGKQKELKVELLRESLFKYARLNDVKINPLISDDIKLGYRNSLKLPLTLFKGKLVSGLYQYSSNHLMPINKCQIHDTEIERIRINVLNVLNKYHLPLYDPKTKKGMRALYIRRLGQKSELCLISGKDEFEKELLKDLSKIEGLSSIYQSINTSSGNAFFGKSFKHLALSSSLDFKFMGLKIKISLPSFFQLNTHMAELLYTKVKELAGEGDTLFEAYSGIGVMSLLLSKSYKKVLAVENIAQAIQNAKAIAKLNKIDNVEFMYDDAAMALKKTAKKHKISTLVLDPPRSGLDDDMLIGITKALPDKIIYVSCNPATLAKNLSYLLKYYRLVEITPFDMFPESAHVESISLLLRK